MRCTFGAERIVVTGGTRGIGAKIVSDLNASGANVIATGTDIENLPEGFRIEGVTYENLDLSSRDSIDEFVKRISKYGKLGGLINNAGINTINPIDQIVEKDWDEILKVNLTGPFLLVKGLVPLMRNNGGGKIVNVASIFGSITKEKRGAYTSSKAGLIGFTKTASVDFAPDCILVNSISPGFIATELTERVLGKEGIETLCAQVPMKRLGQPEEISKVVLFLCSEQNTFLTGQNIIVDGGFVNI